MVTIKDVARRAQVAPGTVSNVLTGNRPVSDAARQRVLAAVDELDYRPNILARSLVNRRSETLAVVASGLEYYGPSRTLVGIEQGADERGYSLLLNLWPRPGDGNVASALADLNARQVDGIIWAVPEIGDNRSWITPETLAQLPPVLFLSMAPRPDLAIVAVDNRLGGELATAHMVSAGRRHIGLITGPMAWWETHERMNGWLAALQAAGLEAPGALVAHGDWSAASGEQAMLQLLAAYPRLDAVFCQNDQMALGALRALHRAGRGVPHDVAVAGFDNQPDSALFWPALTTVFQRLIDLGCLAVQELHRLIEARQAGDSIQTAPQLVPPELIIRESTTEDI